MTLRSMGWLQALTLASVFFTTACSDDPPATPATCTPACSAGYTCTMGTCAALCNPPCGAGESCAVRNGATQCERVTVDAATDIAADDLPPSPQDAPLSADVSTLDTSTGDDSPSASDTPGTGDAPSTGDTPGTDVPQTPCGMTGQPCCGLDPMIPTSTGSCAGANVCDRTSRTCVAYTLESNECTTTATCPAGQVCALGELCSGGTRSCLRCIERTAAGTLPLGAPCGGTITASCADGICANNRCARACVPGAAGDAACQAIRAGTVCAELSQSLRLDGGALSNPVTFGACILGCRRDADCSDAGGNLRCGLSMRRIDNTLQQTCRTVFGTLAAGASCPLSPTSNSDPTMYCQSGQCFPIPMNMTTGYCSTFCGTDADCPTGTGVCRDIPFYRPSGTSAPTQPIRMCERP